MTSEAHHSALIAPAQRILCIVMLLTLQILAAPLHARGASENDGVLTVGAVQFAVSDDIYTGPSEFKKAVNTVLDRMEREAESEVPGRHIDLAVFPEYTSAFLAMAYLDSDEKTKLLGSLEANPIANRPLVIRALKAAEPEMKKIWSEIAAERGYAVLAGSTLVAGSNGEIRNRAMLFNRNGTLQWTQDKSYPGVPETRLLDLEPGRVEEAEPFIVDGWLIVTTICRDTYNIVWEEVMPAADLWIDIKANELPYTREYYDEALAERLPNSPINRGLTVSLSGEILGFRFSGPTEYLYDIGPVAGTDPWAENAILIITHPPNRL